MRTTHFRFEIAMRRWLFLLVFGGCDRDFKVSSLPEVDVTGAAAECQVAKPVQWNVTDLPVVLSLNDVGKRRSTEYVDVWLARVLTKVFLRFRTELGVREVVHWGMFVCKTLGDGWSRHAYALAIDIRALQLEDGSTVTVLDDWGDPIRGAVLHRAHEILKQNFSLVLTPESNADHRDHFHADLDPEMRHRED